MSTSLVSQKEYQRVDEEAFIEVPFHDDMFAEIVLKLPAHADEFSVRFTISRLKRRIDTRRCKVAARMPIRPPLTPPAPGDPAEKIGQRTPGPSSPQTPRHGGSVSRPRRAGNFQVASRFFSLGRVPAAKAAGFRLNNLPE